MITVVNKAMSRSVLRIASAIELIGGGLPSIQRRLSLLPMANRDKTKEKMQKEAKETLFWLENSVFTPACPTRGRSIQTTRKDKALTTVKVVPTQEAAHRGNRFFSASFSPL